jgi:glycosyltransferase involved in cell wall biosynthesis
MSYEPMMRPVRVLMYTAYFDPEYSGAALQALTLARELRRRGHRVEFVTNRWPGLPERGEVEGFQVWRLEPGRLRKHRELRLWYNLARFVWRRRHEFDILHSHGAYYTHAFIGPLGRVTGLKTLVKASLANDDLQDLSRPVIGWLHRLMLRRIDACVAISQDLAQEFRAGGLDPARIHYLPNGVDTGRFHPAEASERARLRGSLGLPAGRPIALYIGVLDERKNILWLAEQWVANRGFGTDALLVAVGPQSREDPEGVLRGRLEALGRGAPELFQLRDFTPDILSWYQSADVLVLPSLKEGLPNVVLEAMACGLPCVAARASGSWELIVQGRTGYTYEHGDAQDMARALSLCLEPEGRSLGAEARRLVEERYAIRAIADRYEALYARLLGMRASTRPEPPDTKERTT